MSKYLYIAFLVAIAIFSVSHTYGHDNKWSSHDCCQRSGVLTLTPKQEVFVTFINSTGTDICFTVLEQNKDTSFQKIKEINLKSNETAVILLSVSLHHDNKTSIHVNEEGFGYVSRQIELDMEKQNIIELISYWVYPGDGFWWIKPFRIIEAKVI